MSDERVRVRLTLLSSEEGGRRAPIASGYRPSFWLGCSQRGGPQLHDAAVTLIGRDLLEPGNSAAAELIPSLPEAWSNSEPGQALPIHEGSRVVGKAVLSPQSDEVDGLRNAVEALDPSQFERLVSVLISKREHAVRREVAEDGAHDVAVSGDGGVIVYQIAPSSSFEALAESVRRAFPDIAALFLIAQGDPTTRALQRLEATAGQLKVPAAWFTPDWLVQRLGESPDVVAYFLQAGRDVVRTQLEFLRSAWAHGAAEHAELLTAVQVINSQNPFLEWAFSTSVAGIAKDLITREKYPGARIDARNEGIAA